LCSRIIMHHWHHHITPNRMTGSDSGISPARYSFIISHSRFFSR
jgi:hypothetical protein